MTKPKAKRVQLVVPVDDYASWAEIAKESKSSIARLVRVAVRHIDRARLVAMLRDAA